LGAGANLFANRVPFDLGVAIGLAALALVVRSTPPRVRSARGLGALLLAVLCALASPIAGAFLALAALAWALASPRVRRGLALAVLLPALAYWQVNAAVADFASGVSDRAEHASYYAPLLRELRTLGVGFGERPARIEVVATANHAEARFAGVHVMLARGWER